MNNFNLIVHSHYILESESYTKMSSILEAPAITTFPTHVKSQIFYVGITINLLCMAKGRPVPKVQWFKDNSDLPLQESSGSILYQIKSASNEDSGKYTCLATNRAGDAKRTIEYIIFRECHFTSCICF